MTEESGVPESKTDAAPENHTLTPMERLFVAEYPTDFNATQAAIRAGYSEHSARQIGSENLSKPYIQAALRAAQDERLKKAELDGIVILKELYRIATSDLREIINPETGCAKPPSEWPDHVARAVASFDVEEIFERQGNQKVWTGYLKKVKLWPKTHALELLGKNLKLWIEKIEVSGTLKLEDLVAGASIHTLKKEAS